MNHRELWNMGGAPLLIKATWGLLFWYPLLIVIYALSLAVLVVVVLSLWLSSVIHFGHGTTE